MRHFPFPHIVSLAVFLLGAAFLLVVLVLPAWAEVEVLTASHTHVMGDSESRNQARTICFNEAKRKLVEQAGSYVETLSRTENFELATDEVVAFSAAFIRVNTDREEWAMLGDTLTVTMDLSAQVDPDEVKQLLAELAQDAAARSRLTENLEQQSQAEAQLALESDPPTRERLSDDIDVLRAEQAAILTEIETSTRFAAELVQKGITSEEIETMLGSPRARKSSSSGDYSCWNYGHVWVVFHNGLASCMRTRLEYNSRYGGDCHCTGLSMNFLMQ